MYKSQYARVAFHARVPNSLPSCFFAVTTKIDQKTVLKTFGLFIVPNYRVLFRNHFKIIVVLLSSTFSVRQTNIVLGISAVLRTYFVVHNIVMTIESTHSFILLLFNSHVNSGFFILSQNLSNDLSKPWQILQCYITFWGRSENKTQGWKHIISFNDDKSIFFLRYLDEW